MKNIFLLQTDQPSRLYLEYGDGDLCLSNHHLPQTARSNNQHLYITSDEEIKEGDWCLNANKDTIYKKDKYPMDISWDKIILTTDKKLIAEGVQAIDDEFLEWYVKNSSCEFVRIESWETKGEWDLYYKITIPQEEPKQDLEKEMFELEQQLDIPSSMRWHNSKPKQEKKPHSFCETPEEKCVMNYCDENGCQNRKRHLVEPHEQETLEEAAERHYINCIPSDRHSFITGANWQAERGQKIVPFDAVDIEVFAIKPDENGKLFAYIGYKITNGNFEFNVVPFTEPQAKKMYSEEEVKRIIDLHSGFIDSGIDYEGINNATTAISTPDWDDDEWFEQFKKK